MKTYSELVKENTDMASQLKGPDGFVTWKDAAIDERVRRVASERREQELAAHVVRMDSLIQQAHRRGVIFPEWFNAHLVAWRQDKPATFKEDRHD